MLTDRYEHDLGRLLRIGLAPSPGWDARALAALVDIRPRRHPNLLTYIIVAALILLLAAGVFAAVRYFFFEGTLEFQDFGPVSTRSDLHRPVSVHFLSDEAHLEQAPDSLSAQLDYPIQPLQHSPQGDLVCFHRKDGWPPARSDILTAKPDGSDEVNLTERAGLGGVSCRPKWSGGGAKIAFSHSDPQVGQLPCHAGLNLWIMNADGSDAHWVIGGEMEIVWVNRPGDGRGSGPDRYFLCNHLFIPGPDEPPGLERSGRTFRVFDLDTQTGEILRTDDVLCIAGDKGMAVQERRIRGEVHGRPGVWNQLILWRLYEMEQHQGDGWGYFDESDSEPEVLLEQFIADADVAAHYPTEEQLQLAPDFDWQRYLWDCVGPGWPSWSPSGDKFAFLAALPWDPDGPYHLNQVEVWVYDLTTDELTRITNDDVMQHGLSWHGE